MKKHLLSLLQNDFTTISVAFEDDGFNYANSDGLSRERKHPAKKNYTYKVALSDVPALRISMCALVTRAEMTVGSNAVAATIAGLKIVRVMEIHEEPMIDTDADFDYKWIVAPVVADDYLKRVTQEVEFKKLVRSAERETARQQAMDNFYSTLPAGGEARKLFEKAMEVAGVLPSFASLTKPQMPPNIGTWEAPKNDVRQAPTECKD